MVREVANLQMKLHCSHYEPCSLLRASPPPQCAYVRIIFKANASDLKMFPITKGDGREWSSGWKGKERREGREVFQVSGVVDIMYRAFEARFNG